MRKVQPLLIPLGVTLFLGTAILCFVYMYRLTPPQKWIALNQSEINSLDLQYARLTWTESLLVHLSRLSAAAMYLVTWSSDSFDYDDSGSVLRYVFRRLPLIALVLPSEGYYYFKITKSGVEVSGNFRLTDIEDGHVTWGYFRPGQSRAIAKSGLFAIGSELTTRKLFGRTWLIGYEGHYRIVVMPSVELTAPPEWPGRKNEKFVASVRDESGTALWLSFVPTTSNFLYLLDTRKPLTEVLIEEEGLLVGQRTGFVFKRFENRMVLIGVSKAQIRANSSFDGPFDQVPARHPIRNEVLSAYSYLRMVGVDEFGYLCTSKSIRVAISPYITYHDRSQVNARVNACAQKTNDPVLLEHCITFEDKQAFHLTSDAFDSQGQLKGDRSHICDHTTLLNKSVD